MTQNRQCISFVPWTLLLTLILLSGCGKDSTEQLSAKKAPCSISFYNYNVSPIQHKAPLQPVAQTKKNPTYFFPGSFCPPIIGHLFVVKKAAEFLPEVTIVCSVNPDKKDRWFSQEKCKELWLSYPLPANVNVTTFDAIKNHINGPDIVMIRGIRDEKDLDEEKKILLLNAQQYHITKFLYIIDDKHHERVSSTTIRELAEKLKLEELGNYVSPMVMSALLEKVLHIKNLFMVVGKPGVGKSTFLKMLTEANTKNIFINTDELNHELRPFIQAHFKGENLMNVALNKQDELLALITQPWLELLKARLRKVPSSANVFLEIGYGMEPKKSMFRYVGGKVIYVGCKHDINIERNKLRGTPHLQAFIDKIPDLEATKQIAEAHKLELICIDTNCSLDSVKQLAHKFNDWLQTNTNIRNLNF